MSKPSVIFALYHIHDRTFDDVDWREFKRIGLFNNKKQCEDLVGSMKDDKGFRDHPVTCFKIFEYEIGRAYWRTEF